MAHQGTLFLDDVDTLPLGIQAKLLRAIQEGEVQRLGSTEIRHVDVRVVAATNRDLAAEVHAGRFRADLYYRLNVVPIAIPPLRERPDDIPLLMQHFIAREAAKSGRTITAIADDALAEARSYPWPGNVRELRNVVERAMVMGTGEVFRLPGPLRAPTGAGAAGADPDDSRSLAERVRAYKVELISRALDASGGNQRRAAELLAVLGPGWIVGHLERMARRRLQVFCRDVEDL